MNRRNFLTRCWQAILGVHIALSGSKASGSPAKSKEIPADYYKSEPYYYRGRNFEIRYFRNSIHEVAVYREVVLNGVWYHCALWDTLKEFNEDNKRDAFCDTLILKENKMRRELA